jgi:hypothetical protein
VHPKKVEPGSLGTYRPTYVANALSLLLNFGFAAGRRSPLVPLRFLANLQTGGILLTAAGGGRVPSRISSVSFLLCLTFSLVSVPTSMVRSPAP